MPIEYCFSFDGEETDHNLLDPGERSGLYPDYATGKRQLFGVICDPEDVGTVEIYLSEGVLAEDGPENFDEDEMPSPIGRVRVREGEDHRQEIRVGELSAELVVRHVAPDAIRFSEDAVNIPRSLIYPQ